MAEKISDSIKRKLNRLRKVLDSEPSKPSAPKKGAREKQPPPNADRPPTRESAPETAGAAPEKKKTPAKPWYHHRQRW